MNITDEDRRRFKIIAEEIGCIPCRIFHGQLVHAQVNHLLNGYRLGHQATVPECPWHHMGECLTGVEARQMKKYFGPSRARNKKQFAKVFGSDARLLLITNNFVKQFESKIIGGTNANIE